MTSKIHVDSTRRAKTTSKKLITLAILFLFTISARTQTRVSLLEEFTGETCMPCATYNPALDYLLKQPSTLAKLIAIKWEVPIPVAPMSVNSLYLTNQAEIDWRYKGVSNSGYGYQAQYSPTYAVNDGILNAPTCFIDGKNQWTFGAVSDHPYYLNNTVINTAAAVSTPFSIALSPVWNSNVSSCVVTATVTSSSAFTALGSLMFRLCLVEREIEFAVAPGFNGETKFYDVVRKSYPTSITGTAVTNMGTPLPTSWTAGQTQILTITCAIPSYIMDRSQMAFVGFVQDDGDRQVYQTAKTPQASIPNDAKAEGVLIAPVVCASTVLPSALIKNNGPTAITSLTITPLLNGSPGASILWTGNLSSLSTATIPLNSISPGAATVLCGFVITGVSGGDVIPENNQAVTEALIAPVYNQAPLSEGFESSTTLPQNWKVINSSNTFSINTMIGAYGLSYRSISYPLRYAAVGEEATFYLPPTNLIGTINSELSFDIAYQQQLPENKDSLLVSLSSDCGSTWSSIFRKGGSSIATVPSQSDIAFMAIASDWTTHIVSLTNYANAPEVIIKFSVKGDHGNGIFLDNINLKAGTGNPTVTTSILNYAKNENNFTLYPNPANAYLTIDTENKDSKDITLEIENTFGQIVYSAIGSGQLKVDCRNFENGIYYVKVNNGISTVSKKLLISK